jgi:hypothetical protein
MHAGVLRGADAGDRSKVPEDADAGAALDDACLVSMPVNMNKQADHCALSHKLTWIESFSELHVL